MDTDPACQDAIFDEFLPACANLGAQRATFYNVLILLTKFKYHKNRFAHDILSIMTVCYRNCFPFVRQNRRLTGEVRENGLASLREELYISRCCWNLDLTQRDLQTGALLPARKYCSGLPFSKALVRPSPALSKAPATLSKSGQKGHNAACPPHPGAVSLPWSVTVGLSRGTRPAQSDP